MTKGTFRNLLEKTAGFATQVFVFKKNWGDFPGPVDYHQARDGKYAAFPLSLLECNKAIPTGYFKWINR
jgi:hypothetical protein